MNPDMNKPVCAITGTGGYVGTCIKDYFGQQGWDVLELTRRPRPATRAVAFQLGAELPPGALAETAALVHCAYDFKPLRWEEIQTVNVEGTRKILEAARSAGIGKIVCLSSLSAFEGCRSLYGRAKLEIEKIALDCGALVLRPGLVYGSGPGGMFGKLVGQVRQSSVQPIFGNGSQLQFLVHHQDLASFIERCASGETNLLPRILAAAHQQPWRFREILEAIARQLNKKITFVPLPWQLVWAGLKSAEVCGMRLNFRSDSLISLMHQNPKPDFSPNVEAGLACRPFEIEKLPL
jgi:nucleoside-diphosphate-sugar epimerase